MRYFPRQAMFYGIILIGIFSFLGFEFQTAYALLEVDIKSGTSVPGCEVTNSCFVPYTVTIQEDEQVQWDNQDSAVHTVTSGSASSGQDGNFDSGLIMSGSTFYQTFTNGGTFPYFCIVHPWMTGKVIVEEQNNSSTQSSTTTLPSMQTSFIELDSIPSTLPLGSSIKFTGKLTTPQGTPISGKTVWINVESHQEEDKKGSAITDSNGHFTAEAHFWGSDTGLWYAQAEFDGDSKYYNTQSGVWIVLVTDNTTTQNTSTEPPEKISTPSPVELSTTIDVKITKSSFNKGDIITIYGTVSKSTGSAVALMISGPTGNLVYIDQVIVDKVNNFVTKINTENIFWDTSGMYSLKALYGESVDVVSFQYQTSNLSPPKSTVPSNTLQIPGTTYQIPYTINGGSVDDVKISSASNSLIVQIRPSSDGTLTITPSSDIISGIIMVILDGEEWEAQVIGNKIIVNFPEWAEVIEIIGTEVFNQQNNPYYSPPSYSNTNPSSTSVNSDVIIAQGSGVPGCENFNFCYLPFNVQTAVGHSITWYNADSAAHTVTSGVVTDVNSLGAVFDSGLLLAGNTFSHKFTRSGNVPYFCIVHPWMIGEVTVTDNTQENSVSTTKLKVPIVVSTDKKSYSDGEIIHISGQVKDRLKDYPVTITIFSPNGNQVLVHQVVPDNLSYNTQITAGGSAWNESGSYTLKVIYGTDARNAETVIEFNSVELKKPDPVTTSQFTAFASEADVVIASGSSVPGCEKTSVCYEPDWVLATAGDKVTWFNGDSAAHTVTSGSPRSGPNGFFDSGLIMPGETFTHEFSDSRNQFFYCMIHPWMEGAVIVDTAEKYSDSNQELSLYDFRDTLKELEVFPSSQVKFKVVFVTSDDECSDRNYESVHHYNLITDSYLSRYGIDAHKTQSQCITENELDGLLDKIESENIELIIIIADWELSETHSKCGEDSPSSWGCFSWDRGHVYSIVSNSRTLFTKSDSAAWTLSHELSHFALKYNGEPRSVFENWVHNIQAQVNQCAPQNSDDIFGYYNEPVNNCPPSLYLAMWVDGKMVRVMQPYYNNQEYKYDTRTELNLDKLPAAVREGQKITFSGFLSNIDGIPVGYSTINIVDEDKFNPDSPLVSTKTDAYGKFSVDWIVEDTDFWDDTLEIFAVFEEGYDMQQDRTPIQKVYIYRP